MKKRRSPADAERKLVSIQFRRDGEGWIAIVSVPGAAANITAAAAGGTKAHALTRAGALAESILKDPIVSAIIPPQALVAVHTARKLGQAAKAGGNVLKGIWGTLHGPGKQRLAKALTA